MTHHDGTAGHDEHDTHDEQNTQGEQNTRGEQNTQGEQNTRGVPDSTTDADTASGGSPEEPDLTTDEHGKPVDNPSGG